MRLNALSNEGLTLIRVTAVGLKNKKQTVYRHVIFWGEETYLSSIDFKCSCAYRNQ